MHTCLYTHMHAVLLACTYTSRYTCMHAVLHACTYTYRYTCMHIHGHYAVAILQEREPILNNPSQPKPIQDILAMLVKPALPVKTMERMLAKAKSVDDVEKIMSDVDEFGSKMRKYLGAAANIKKVDRERARSMLRAKLRATVQRDKNGLPKRQRRGKKERKRERRSQRRGKQEKEGEAKRRSSLRGRR